MTVKTDEAIAIAIVIAAVSGFETLASLSSNEKQSPSHLARAIFPAL